MEKRKIGWANRKSRIFVTEANSRESKWTNQNPVQYRVH